MERYVHEHVFLSLLDTLELACHLYVKSSLIVCYDFQDGVQNNLGTFGNVVRL